MDLASEPFMAVQIGMERSRLLELQEKAGGLSGKIATQRKAMGGINAARESNIQVYHSMLASSGACMLGICLHCMPSVMTVRACLPLAAIKPFLAVAAA